MIVPTTGMQRATSTEVGSRVGQFTAPFGSPPARISTTWSTSCMSNPTRTRSPRLARMIANSPGHRQGVDQGAQPGDPRLLDQNFHRDAELCGRPVCGGGLHPGDQLVLHRERVAVALDSAELLPEHAAGAGRHGLELPGPCCSGVNLNCAKRLNIQFATRCRRTGAPGEMRICDLVDRPGNCDVVAEIAARSRAAAARLRQALTRRIIVSRLNFSRSSSAFGAIRSKA